MKTTYNDIFLRKQILTNIPTQMEGRKVSPSTATSLLLMRIAYQKKSDEFEETVRKALDELKKEERFKDFDKLSEEQEQATAILARKKAHDEWNGENERPAAPSDEEIAKAEAAKEKEADFRKVYSELAALYNEARMKQAALETTIEVQQLSRAELEDIVGVVGYEGTIALTGMGGDVQQEPRMSFLSMVANYLV